MQGCQIWPLIGSDWHQMRQIWDFKMRRWVFCFTEWSSNVCPGSPPLTAVAAVHVHVIDSSSPLFESPIYETSVPENVASHTPVKAVKAISPHGQKLIYSISRGDKYGEFSLDFNTGELLPLFADIFILLLFCFQIYIIFYTFLFVFFKAHVFMHLLSKYLVIPFGMKFMKFRLLMIFMSVYIDLLMELLFIHRLCSSIPHTCIASHFRMTVFYSSHPILLYAHQSVYHISIHPI